MPGTLTVTEMNGCFRKQQTSKAAQKQRVRPCETQTGVAVRHAAAAEVTCFFITPRSVSDTNMEETDNYQ